MQKIHDAYKYSNCCFAIQKDKEGTARITVWKDLRIDYVYTLESSFCGSEYGQNYLENDYEKIGKKLCEGITCLFHQDIQNTLIASNKSTQLLKTIEKLAQLKNKVQEEFNENPKLTHIGDEDDSGSQSEPDVG